MGQKRAALIGGGVVAAALVALLGYGGSHQAVACSAAYQAPVVPLVLTGDSGAVDSVRYCFDDRCGPVDVPVGPTDAATPTPSVVEHAEMQTATPPTHGRRWTLAYWGGGYPDRITVTALRGDAAAATETYPLTWHEPADTTCAPPKTTPPITLPVPA